VTASNTDRSTATLERDQGANVWLVFAIREGKNREVRNVHGASRPRGEPADPGSYGPFQLGELAEGQVEEVKTRVLREQLGEKIARSRARISTGRCRASQPSRRRRRAARQEAVQAGRQERPDRRPQGPPRAGAAHRQRRSPRPQRGRGRGYGPPRRRSAATTASAI
jgi:23S rRNA pseudouridine2605 synthase